LRATGLPGLEFIVIRLEMADATRRSNILVTNSRELRLHDDFDAGNGTLAAGTAHHFINDVPPERTNMRFPALLAMVARW